MEKIRLFNEFVNNSIQEAKAPNAAEISYDTPRLTFNKCFMSYDAGTGSVITFGYDTLADLCELYGIDSNDTFYSQVDKLEVGESVSENNGTILIITRIQ